MAAAETNEESVDYDTITGRPKAHHTGTPASAACPHSTVVSTGKALGTEATSANESVEYDTLRDGAGHNVDADAQTLMGIEIKERFNSMRAAFLKIDHNRDGKITKKELLEMCREWSIPTSEAERVLRVADLDHSHTIDFHEFAQRFDPHECSNAGESVSNVNPVDSRPVHAADSRPIQSCGWGESASGSGTRAVRAVKEGCASSESASAGEIEQLRKKNTELEEELTKYKTKVADLEKELAKYKEQDRANESRTGLVDEGDQVQDQENEKSAKPSDASDMEKEIAEHKEQDRTKESRSDLGMTDVVKEQADHPQSKDRGQQESPLQARIVKENEQVQDQEGGRSAKPPDLDKFTVYVYGRMAAPPGHRETTEMMGTLRHAKIQFEMRDFDNDKSFADGLDNEVCIEEVKKPPVVRYGSKLWWDNGKSDSCFPFQATVALELRHERNSVMAEVQASPIKDGDIDTEIAERFRSMREAFLNIDANRDGHITKNEIFRKCKEWNISTSEAERVIGEVDSNHDRKISFDEFAKWIDHVFPHSAPKATKGHSR